MVTLKHNIILEGSKFLTRGDVVDVSVIPEWMRTKDYIIQGEHPDQIYDLMRMEEISGEDGPKIEDLEPGMMQEEEFAPKPGTKSYKVKAG
jgi:hypothetical protein